MSHLDHTHNVDSQISPEAVANSHYQNPVTTSQASSLVTKELDDTVKLPAAPISKENSKEAISPEQKKAEWKEAKSWLYSVVKRDNRLCYWTTVVSSSVKETIPYAIFGGFTMCVDALVAGSGLLSPAFIIPAAVILAGLAIEAFQGMFIAYLEEKDESNQGENLNSDYYDGVANYKESELQSEQLKQDQVLARDNFLRLTGYVSNAISLRNTYLGFALGMGALVAAQINPVVLALAAASIVPRFLTERAYSKALERLEHELKENELKLEFLDLNFLENESLVEMKNFQRAKYIADKARERYRHSKDRELAVEWRHTILGIPADIFDQLVFLGGVGVAFLGLASGSIGPGAACLAFYALNDFHDNIGGLADKLAEQTINRSFIRKIYRTVTGHSNDECYDPPEDTFNWSAGPPKIVVDNVTVQYPGADDFALKNVSLEIGSGEVIALIGPTGAGKSTLVKTIQGQCEANAGAVLLNDTTRIDDVRHEWRSHTRKMQQDFVLFRSLTLRENLEIGRSPFWDSSMTIEEAIEATGAEKAILAKRNGLDTTYGTGLDTTSSELSGGQAQLVALTRTILSDPGILILDEPSANLDPQTSADLTEFIQKFSDNRTVIYITHDMGSVMRLNPDKVVSIQDGQIVEQGTISELLEKDDGYFKRMYDLEAEAYEVD